MECFTDCLYKQNKISTYTVYKRRKNINELDLEEQGKFKYFFFQITNVRLVTQPDPLGLFNVCAYRGLLNF